MYKEGFDVYDELPEDMVVYLRYNGRHFNRKLVEFATSKMTTRDSNGTEIALYLGSSVPDGLHLCLYVKDVIDDVDGYDGIAFNRWYADMCRKGIQVD